ncbi:MAG: RNA polymerase subunit sigma-24 [Rhodovulum sulfidophilum]|uniref:RNA polymerase subunit sigma-24 n=1 Tax=Rhodovulum sulfidophilum TaxID=35806 RepID=A0A2W5PTT8_RHOSU|nr:MAG: RNA polymerase subunit sigma-24 [Rhodovulum sulfidophilum]
MADWDPRELFRGHAAGVARSLRRAGLSPETAEDLTQDAFLRVLLRAPAAPGPGATFNPVGYLYAVARNLRADHARRTRRDPRVALSEAAFANIADPAPGAETVVYDRQRLALVEAALAELPPRTRHAFEAHRLGERTIAEVAAELDLSVGRTWALIRDAYAHLRRRLDEA